MRIVPRSSQGYGRISVYRMHLRELFTQPVNLIVAVTFVFLFGITITSVVLDNSGYPNPITSLGAKIALMIWNHAYGE